MNIIDIFAGAGGLSVGGQLAGGNVRGCVELDAVSCATLESNPKYHGLVLRADVTATNGGDLRRAFGIRKNDPLVIVGGAPCQPFSKAAYWTEAGEEAAFRRARAQGIKTTRPPRPKKVKEDKRRNLVEEFWRLVRETHADGFVFENVPSIKHPRNLPIYNRLIEQAHKCGFKITEVVGRAVDFGVPQQRERVFVLGSRKAKPKAPEATHSFHENTKQIKKSRMKRAVTAGEALEDFSSRRFHEPEETISGKWASHLHEIPPGWNYKALTAWAGHSNPAFVAETRFWNFLLKLSPERPSWTLAASPGPWTGPFHWDTRRLRVPEMLALQTFPRGYLLAGSRRDRVRQMGNAVPVLMAKAMIKEVLEAVS